MSDRAHVVVGAGLIGQRVSRLLVARGDAVALATRSGVTLPGARTITADASDTATLTTAADGTHTIFLCTNPKAYTADEWQRSWPPIFRAAIGAAHETGAGLVVMGNLYPYGSPDGAMTEHSPEVPVTEMGRARSDGWAAVKAAHDAGELQAVEVRASDYFGPGAGPTAHLGARFFVPLMASKTARVIGDPAMPHSWSYLDDIAATLVAAADYRGVWGRVWHVASGEPRTRLEIAATVNEWFGSHGAVKGIPPWQLRALGLASPEIRGVAEESHQFTRPFVIDGSDTERMLGVHATPWEQALRETAQSYRNDV